MDYTGCAMRKAGKKRRRIRIMKKVFSLEVAGRTLSVEVGQFAQLANGAAMVRYGDTAILSTATMSKQPEG